MNVFLRKPRFCCDSSGGGGEGEDVFNRALAEAVFALFLFLPLFFLCLIFMGLK